MTVRDELILHHTAVHPALRRELAARGLTLRHGKSGAEANEKTLGAIAWFYDALRHPLDIWAFKRKLRRFGIPLLAWNHDAPHYLNRASWRLDLLDRVRLLDVYATHTLIDKRRKFADLQLYLQNAADISNYNAGADTAATLSRLRDGSAYEFDVCFFGAMDGSRYREMQARQVFFIALADRLKVLGVRYLFREADGMSSADQVRLVQRSRISLNYGASCEYGAAVASGLPERCYGIPACGGFLLCDKRTHARDDFTVGENWAEYDGLDDCVAKIIYWLKNFAAARALAERCHAHVMAHHTYAHRAEKMHKALLAWHEGQRGLIR